MMQGLRAQGRDRGHGVKTLTLPQDRLQVHHRSSRTDRNLLTSQN